MSLRKSETTDAISLWCLEIAFELHETEPPQKHQDNPAPGWLRTLRQYNCPARTTFSIENYSSIDYPKRCISSSEAYRVVH